VEDKIITIAKFFKEIGWVDELWSGVRNIYKYNKIYSGADPIFIEGDVFKTVIPLTTPATTLAVTGESDERTIEILEYYKQPRSRQEIQDFIGIKDARDFRKRVLNPLINGGLLKRTIPESLTSPKQKHYSDR